MLLLRGSGEQNVWEDEEFGDGAGKDERLVDAASKTSAGVVQVHAKYIRQYYNNDSFAPSPPSMDVYVRATTD